MSGGGGSSKRKKAEAEARNKAKKQEAALNAQIATQRAELERQQSDLAMRTQAGLRARQRGRGLMLLGNDEQESTLG
jgi:hypothetical protein